MPGTSKDFKFRRQDVVSDPRKITQNECSCAESESKIRTDVKIVLNYVSIKD